MVVKLTKMNKLHGGDPEPRLARSPAIGGITFDRQLGFKEGSTQPDVEVPTPEEDAEITARAEADPGGGLLTDEEFAAAPRVRGPQKSPTKVRITMRLDADVVETLRSGDRGWQTRVNDLLRQALLLGAK